MFSKTKETLRLVQFNVENLFLNLGLYNGQDLKKITEAEWKKFSTSSTPNKSLQKTWALAETIEDLSPDILMLNEVGGLESLENFNRLFLNDGYNVYLKEGNSNRGIDVGYLVRKDLAHKAVLISHKDRPLHFLYPHESQTPSGGKSHYFSRDVAELRLFHPNENTPRLVILLTHLKSKLDSEKIDSEGRLRRAAELKTLVQIYNEVKREVGDRVPICVAGDFNGVASRENTESEFLPLYQNTDLVETFEAAGTPLPERFSQIQISPLGKTQHLQIDYIFISQNWREKVIPGANQTFAYRFKDHLKQALPFPKTLEDRMRLPSDHYPIVATIRNNSLMT